MRSHYTDQLHANMQGETVTICGWLQGTRALGGLLFARVCTTLPPSRCSARRFPLCICVTFVQVRDARGSMQAVCSDSASDAYVMRRPPASACPSPTVFI
jgi:aspartyl-tRNA synthetase